MYFHTLIIRTSRFPFLGLLDGIFHFYSNLNRVYSILEANSGAPYQTPGQSNHCDLQRKCYYFNFNQFKNVIFRILKIQY